MQAKNDILEELGSLGAGAILLEINRQTPDGTPYTLPTGYFEELPDRVMARIEDRALLFSVPEGYFEGLASQVLDRIKAGQAGNGQADHTGSDRLESAREELALLSPTLDRIGRETPYRLPEGYFEEISPLLTLLREKTTYSVPEDYFDRLAAQLVAKAVRPVAETAKVISIASPKGKVLNGNWWKYSAAALVAGIILIFSWPQGHSGDAGAPQRQTLDLAQGLYQVPDQEIQNYMDDQNSILAEPITNSTATLDMNDNDVKTLLGDIPDGELKQYMDEHGRASDIATN
jgi:hypothetical protein